MKTLKEKAIAMALVTVMATGAYAQKIDGSKVPAAVKSGFTKAFPGATVSKWEMENGNYEANFRNNGKATSSVLKPDGTLIETEVEIALAELPAAATAYVKAHYSGYKIKEASKITKADGTLNYEAGVHGKDVVFDSKGTFIKEDED